MSETVEIDLCASWTLAEASAQTGVPTATLKRWIHSGDLPAWRFRYRGPWRVSPADLAHLVTTNRRGAA